MIFLFSMMCPEDKIPMHQEVDRQGRFVGGGTWEGNTYETWSIQVCPHCNLKVKETYQAKKLEKEIKI